MQQSDEQLIHRYLGGDRAATEAVTRWINGAASSFRSRLGADWEDAVQDVHAEILRLLQSRQFRGQSGLITYVWRITMRRCMSLLRRNGRMAGAVEAAVSKEPSALERVLRNERDGIARGVVQRMPAECVELWRRITAGESYQAISLATGVSEGALRVRALRCRQRALEVRGRLETAEKGGAVR